VETWSRILNPSRKRIWKVPLPPFLRVYSKSLREDLTKELSAMMTAETQKVRDDLKTVSRKLESMEDEMVDIGRKMSAQETYIDSVGDAQDDLRRTLKVIDERQE